MPHPPRRSAPFSARSRLTVFAFSLALRPLLPASPQANRFLPYRLALPPGLPAPFAAALVAAALVRLPAWLAERGGPLGLGLRALVLALTFDLGAGRTADRIAAALDRGDSAAASAELQALSGLPAIDAAPQSLARETVRVLAEHPAEGVAAPWLAYALLDLPGAVAVRALAPLRALWGPAPALLLRFPVLRRLPGAGPRQALVAPLAQGAAAAADGLAGLLVAAPADGALADDAPAPADSVRAARRRYRAATALLALATALLVALLAWRRAEPA